MRLRKLWAGLSVRWARLTGTYTRAESRARNTWVCVDVNPPLTLTTDELVRLSGYGWTVHQHITFQIIHPPGIPGASLLYVRSDILEKERPTRRP